MIQLEGGVCFLHRNLARKNTALQHIPVILANTKLFYNICTTSAQRRRRWSNIVRYTND